MKDENSVDDVVITLVRPDKLSYSKWEDIVNEALETYHLLVSDASNECYECDDALGEDWYYIKDDRGRVCPECYGYGGEYA